MTKHKMRNILVVCEGNVLRSKLLASFLEKELENEGYHVWSRGLRAEGSTPVGESSNPKLKQISEMIARQGLPDYVKHVPKPVSAEDIRAADLVLGVTQQVVEGLNEHFEGARQKTIVARRFAMHGIMPREARADIGLSRKEVEKRVRKTGLPKENFIMDPRHVHSLFEETRRLSKHVAGQLRSRSRR